MSEKYPESQPQQPPATGFELQSDLSPQQERLPLKPGESAQPKKENGGRRKRDSARLVWDSKPKRPPSPRDIEFQTAEVVIPNPARDAGTLPYSFRDGLLHNEELDRSKMNRLIWGDNLLAMQALLASGYEGKIDLIYIDPPFDSKADYSHRMTIGGQEVTKEPSVIERLAYRDTWEAGTDSYLDMIYPRFHLMKRLLSQTGGLFIHIGPNISHYIKPLLDEVFGEENYRNEIVWQRFPFHADANRFGQVHEYILFYSRSSELAYNPQRVPLDSDYIASHFTQTDKDGRKYQLDNAVAKGQGPARRFGDKTLEPPKGTHWRWGQETIDRLMVEGCIIFTSEGRPRVKRYLDENEGRVVHSVWVDIPPVNSQADERTDFETQKPEQLLERIINTCSKPGSLVADFFSGSGTTLAVAEKLGRRWIGCDFGKVGIQVTRSRLVQQDAKPFLIENIGNYQREMIYLTGGRIGEMQRIILKLYGATPHPQHRDLGTRSPAPGNGNGNGKGKGNGGDGKDHTPPKPGATGELELVYVGYPDRPTTAKKVEELVKLAEGLDGTGYKRLVILAWDYDYNFDSEWEARLKSMKRKPTVQVERRMIPPDVYDYLKKAKDESEIDKLAEKIQFHEKPYLKLTVPKIEKASDGKAEALLASSGTSCLICPWRKRSARNCGRR